MGTESQRKYSVSSLALVTVAFIAAIILSNQLFRGWRIDLTENNLYTLSDGTEKILENLQEPINLYFYFSDKATANIPTLRDYANRVREMLEEFEETADGKIRLTVIDPLPFSEDEDRAAEFGLQDVQLPGGRDTIYFGLAGTDSVDNVEVISFFQPDKEEFLEYDLAKLVSTLAQPQRPVIGLVAGVAMSGQFDPQTQRMQQPWAVYSQAAQLFEIRNLGTDFDSIDDDVSLLWIVQPKSIANPTLYAIDQFIMDGGNALIFVDPVADADPMAPTPGMPQGMPPMGQGSDLPAFFDAWGLEFSAQEVVADAQLALQISMGGGLRPVRHLGFLGVTSAQLNSDDVVTSDLSSINVATAGAFTVTDDAPADFEPLISATTSSALLPATRFSFLPDPGILQNDFVPDPERHVIAARISGKLPSAFPNGPPPTTVDSGDGDPAAEDESGNHLAESTTTSNLIVVGDVDLLGDQMWVQVQNFFGQQIANAFASNGAFVVNALDSLSGSSDLIGVRSRGTFTRPFTRVEELRVEAESRYRDTEQRLQDELAETERRLGELQSAREDSGDILLTPEQQAEIDRFIAQRSQIRQDLRAVQRDLDRSIERLGTVLKAINIALVPAIVILLVLAAVWRRNRRQDA
ncbi:MAG: Gldg family protein [Gammaproteobacteria bacterium]|nr:Gldg family protein [Gammaproteobacteria bacterium]